jgi:hypothetical protein
MSIASAVVSPAGVRSQQPDSLIARDVAPGVVHKRIVFNSGPWKINVLEVNLRQPGISIRAVRAGDKFFGREKVSSMAARYKGPGKVVGAVNGDFFNIRAASENENNLVIEGNLVKGVRTTDSPYDMFETPHSQFAVDSSNHPLIERFAFSGSVIINGGTIRVDRLNSIPPGNGLTLYTPSFGDTSPSDSVARHPLSIPLKLAGRRGDTLIFRRTGQPAEGKMSLADGGVLAAEGTSRAELRRIAKAETVRIVGRLAPHGKSLRTVMGGWPRLVVHGKSVADSADKLEGTFPRFSTEKHPRTAVGFSRDSTKLFLVTVDGRQESASGVSLADLARIMLALGAYEAMNFDGGGSTAMVVNGHLVNSPSDKGGERAVGSGLLVVLDK